MSFLAYWTGCHDDFLLSGRRLYQHSITNSAKLSSQTYRRAGQRCFELLALTSRPQVRYIHLSERMILPGSRIPSDKYLKEFNFCGTYPLVCERHHASQMLYVARFFYSSKLYNTNYILRLESVKHTTELLLLKVLETGICAYHILPPSTCPRICNSKSYAVR